MKNQTMLNGNKYNPLFSYLRPTYISITFVLCAFSLP